MEFQIYAGESIAESLTALGLPSAFIDKTITCTTIKYHFNLENITKLPKVKKVAELLSARLHEPIKVLSSKTGDFCLEFVREQREFPTYEQTWWKIKEFDSSAISFGIDENNEIVAKKIEELSHILVSGVTNSGKSVFLNNIIMNIHCHKDDTKLVLIDPKKVEFSKYKNSDRLILPLITEVEDAVSALNRLCQVMDERYAELEKYGEENNSHHRFYKIVVMVDELADLMLTSGKEVEEPIVRLAQKGRACGIHLVLATQRPTVNVVTGLIKANMPCRVCFATASVRDSVVMLDKGGAEKLLGKGDCLIQFPDTYGLIRCQSPFVSRENISEVSKNFIPRVWDNSNSSNLPPKTRKTGWVDKLLNKLGFVANRHQRTQNKGISTPKSQVPYNIEEQNFFDCVEDDEEE